MQRNAERYELLDGMRGIAAIVVLLLHALANAGYRDAIPNGHLAVDFFFCLSGFVVCHAYERKLLAGLGLVDFVKLRVIRLYPMILIGLAIGFAVFVVRIPLQHHRDWISGGLLSLLVNGALLPSPFLTMGYDAAWPLNGPHWSITFEMLANIVYAAALYRLRFAALSLMALICGAALIFVIFKYGLDVGWRWHELHLGVVRVMFPFLSGVMLYRTLTIWRVKRLSNPYLVALPIALLLAFFFVPSAIVPSNVVAVLFVLAVSPAIVAFVAALPAPALGSRFSQWCGFLGVISYPVYAIHHPLMRLVQVLLDKYNGVFGENPSIHHSCNIWGCMYRLSFPCRVVHEPI